MFRVLAAALLATFAWAQSPPAATAPPEVEQALRARLEEFYHYFITQEYRKAEKLIAEDSQDWFYNHNKPQYLSVEIQSITFSDHFTRARATVLAEQFVMFPGFAGKPIKMPVTSDWKIVDGQWFWYIDPEELRHTPFGVIQERTNAPSAPGSLPTSIPTTADFAMNLVKAETRSVKLKPGESAQVAFRNGARGLVNLSIESRPAGIEAALDHAQVEAGGKAVLSVKAREGAKGGTISVRILPTLEVIPIAVTIQ
ncbi:MAG TPA: hypothetical protein VKX45_07975 [Bryobacteraceae bacterium]|jgi:hypothetical protein|nr:hypothetical protein [Bryobacteraceae bacterium]